MYRPIAKRVFWEFDSTIMQNFNDILPLFCTPIWPSHHLSESQEYKNLSLATFMLNAMTSHARGLRAPISRQNREKEGWVGTANQNARNENRVYVSTRQK